MRVDERRPRRWVCGMRQGGSALSPTRGAEEESRAKSAKWFLLVVSRSNQGRVDVFGFEGRKFPWLEWDRLTTTTFLSKGNIAFLIYVEHFCGILGRSRFGLVLPSVRPCSSSSVGPSSSVGRPPPSSSAPSSPKARDTYELSSVTAVVADRFIHQTIPRPPDLGDGPQPQLARAALEILIRSLVPSSSCPSDCTTI